MVSSSITNTQKKVIEIDPEFMKLALRPYRTHATYLKKAYVEIDEDAGTLGLSARGEFSIPESCYIDDTGHFNAVEYNICYNQLGYVFYAYCVQQKLIAELDDYDIDTFWEKQLPNWLILKINSGFRRVLNAKKFYGTWGIKSVKKMQAITYMDTFCTFNDDGRGESTGEVFIGILPVTSN